MLRINPQLIKRHKLNKLIKGINNDKMKSFKYGKAIVVDVKKTGVILDLIIPMTFGLITLGLVKFFGNKEIFRFSW